MMATTAKDQPSESVTSSNERRNQVMVGDLPSTFLRVPTTEEIEDQLTKDGELARQIAQEEMTNYQQQQHSSRIVYTNRLYISIVEAKLNKNYGMTRMDPFCCIRVNHTVYETETCHNGAKNPTWTRPISVMVGNEPVEAVYLEIYDEGTISGNTKVAWTKILLPQQMKVNEAVDDWWPLSGGLGEDKEGTVHVIFTLKHFQQQIPIYNPAGAGVVPPARFQAVPTPPIPGNQQITTQQPDTATQLPQAPLYTQEDIQQLKDLFPSNEEEVIKTVLEASRGNKNSAIDILLNMQQPADAQ